MVWRPLEKRLIDMTSAIVILGEIDYDEWLLLLICSLTNKVVSNGQFCYLWMINHWLHMWYVLFNLQ